MLKLLQPAAARTPPKLSGESSDTGPAVTSAELQALRHNDAVVGSGAIDETLRARFLAATPDTRSALGPPAASVSAERVFFAMGNVVSAFRACEQRAPAGIDTKEAKMVRLVEQLHGLKIQIADRARRPA